MFNQLNKLGENFGSGNLSYCAVGITVKRIFGNYQYVSLLVFQMAHYAYIYFRNAVLERESALGCKYSRVEIVVPTGACGNITGK